MFKLIKKVILVIVVIAILLLYSLWLYSIPLLINKIPITFKNILSSVDVIYGIILVFSAYLLIIGLPFEYFFNRKYPRKIKDGSSEIRVTLDGRIGKFNVDAFAIISFILLLGTYPFIYQWLSSETSHLTYSDFYKVENIKLVLNPSVSPFKASVILPIIWQKILLNFELWFN